MTNKADKTKKKEKDKKMPSKKEVTKWFGDYLWSNIDWIDEADMEILGYVQKYLEK